ncbi:DGQHR domain-containing protein [Geobacter argillaceus]|uniref:DGQHR domain-containing protein n=1 Tax=Geobacter argillaceus TaxID=345631 RepID=A0A562V717_9BACT|nr:DGQHR domain-containing protein [Geobacter argillaceus]TWJ13673.1 DGQHR domain-containing protein [Geobacter argillaceus]
MIKKFPAIKVIQNKWIFYVFSMKSDMLYNVAYVSRRQKDKKSGYQRNLSEKRATEISIYIESLKGVIPNNIILNFDVELNYDTKSNEIGFDVKDDIAWVIDGQHRLYGLSLCEKPIDVVVVAFSKLNISDQAKVFRTVNSTQKGVNSSLIYDLIDLAKDATFIEERAHELIKKLNEEPESPWYTKIKMIGTGPGLITQSAFMECLKPLLEEKKGALSMYSEEEQYGIIKNYFNSIRLTFSDDWANTSSLLTKTMGFYSTMSLLPTVLQYCLSTSYDFTESTIIKAIEPIKEYDFTSTGSLKGVSGKAGVERITTELNTILKGIWSKKKNKKIKL